MRTQVIIVGAGPVGLAMAIDLGKRGIRCTLVEQKAEAQFLPKMERCNARTMEMFRRIGLADRIRAAGLSATVPMDVFIVRSLAEPPILHLPYPSVADAKAQGRTTNDGSLPLEPYQLISQYTLEPLLRAEAEALPTVELLFDTEFIAFQELDDSVSVTVCDSAGARRALEAEYLVGCDGGTSKVRKQLGIKLEGEGDIGRLRQGLFRCEGLHERQPIGDGPGQGRHFLLAADRPIFMIMQDSTQHWTVHAAVDTDEAMRRQFEAIIGEPRDYEMLYCAEWKQNLLLAERYSQGRVFLAGDAVHLVIPTGGLGMNTGVGDAFDLSWKLAATLEGWGGPQLLASYEVERRQVGERVVGASRYASLGYRKWLSQYRPEIGDESEAGEAARRNLAAVADVEQRKSNELLGAELGYRYVDSPIIDNIPGGPEQLFLKYQPTSWPGARLPHVWLEDGSAVQDLLRTSGYTLLVLAPDVDVRPLVGAFDEWGAPLAIVSIPDAAAREVYERPLILLRPDMHVAWRGVALPDDPSHLAGLVTGHGKVERGKSDAKRDVARAIA